MTLNGREIGGLITEEHRANWANMPLEAMYNELTNELISLHSAVRSDPYWEPRSKIEKGKRIYDPIDITGSGAVEETRAIAVYRDIMRPSGIRAPMDVFMKSKAFSRFADIYKKLITAIYDAFKDFETDADKQSLLDIVKNIAETSPQETFDIIHPKTAEIVVTLYTPENKMLANDVLKNIGGNINYNPLKFNIKRKTNSQEYKDAWNKVIKTLDKKQFDDETLNQVLAALNNQ